MKRILLLLALFSTLAASAQFPSKDSLQRYINRWIRNSAVDAFTNLRLNTALNGLLTEIKGVATTNSGIANVIIDGDSLRIITTLPDTFSVYYPTGGAVATNLSVSRTTTQVNVQSSTGTTGILPPASQFFAGVMTAADKTALDSAVSRALLRDSVGRRLRNIYRRGDSVFYITSGAETFAFLADASVGSGTVTSVGSGYGLSGGPITTTGALVVDSAALSLKYLRRADSLTAYTSRYRLDTANAALRTLIAGKLSNITGLVGVGTGLSIVGTGVAGDPYLLSNVSSGGTVTSVGSGYGLTGGPITGAGSLVVDTATLAARFLRRGDTALIFTDYRNVINARMKYTDTVSLSDRINAKGSGTVTSVSFTDGGGFDGTISNATTTPTISLTQQNAAADGATKGQSGFAAADFNAASGIISIDWVNTQKASSSLSGALSASDYIDFTNKLSNITGLVTAGTNVSITGSGTSGSPYVINATPGGGGSGTVNSGLANTLAYYAANGTVVDDLAAITASRALVSNVNGLPVASSVTATELGYVSGVTSGIQTQLNGKQSTITTGSTAQYFRGDFSLATFPTNVSTFTNDASYLTNITGKVSAGTNVSVTGLGTTASPYVINSSAGTTYTGTTNRLTVTGSVLDIAATYVGQTSITTLGTIGTGTYQATPIADAYVASSATWNAKMSNPLTTTGDLVYGVGSTPTRLAAGTSGYVLTSNGPSTAPSWQPAGGTGTVTSFVFNNANGITGSVGTATTVPTLTLSLDNNSIVYGKLQQGTARSLLGVSGNSAANYAPIQGTTDQVMRVASDGASISFGAINLASAGAVSGLLADAFISSATTWNGKQAALVSGTNIKTINGTTLLGSGDISISGTIADGDKTDITVSGTGTVFTIDNLAVTNAKINDVAYSKVTGVPNAVSDASTKGVATFVAADFTDAAGVIGLDYVNGQAATGSVKGFLTSTDWTTFNNKQTALVSGTNIKTINGNTVLGSGDVTIATSSAQAYYVDAAGLSTGSGSTEATAVTMARLMTLSSSFTGGERIFFKAGGRYNGRILLKSGSYVTRYGTGANPIISGAVPTNSYTWSQAGAIWSTTVSSRVGRVLLNGVAQRTAQSAYYAVSSRPSANQITSTSLVGLSNVTQMEVISKEYEFRFTYNTISAHNSGTGTITLDANNGIVATYGFKLFNHESLIAADGDWAWRSNTLYWRTPGNVNPNTLTADVALYDEGLVFETGGTGFTVEGVEFYGQSKDAIYARNVNNVRIVNNNFHDQLNHAAAITGSNDGVVIQNNIVSDVGFSGFSTYTAKNFDVSNNTITNVGTQSDPPFTRDKTSRYDNLYSVNAGINIGTYSSYGVVNDNYVSNSAYIGIRVDGHEIVVDKNQTYTYGTRQNDGSGIYTNGNNGDGTSIAYNIAISNNIAGGGVGNNEGGPSGQNLTSGIYLDNYTTLTKVTGNTTYDNGGFGVFVGGTTKDIDVRGNVMYNNARASLAILNWPTFDAFAYQTTNIKVENNTMTQLTSTQRAFYLFDFISTAFNPADAGGYMRDNTIISPYTSNVLLRTVSASTQTDMTLATAKSTYTTENFGQKDAFTASYTNEATAKLAVPLKVNSSQGAATVIVPESHRNPINKYFDPIVPSLGSTVFINSPYSGGGSGGSMNLQDVTDIGNVTSNALVLSGSDPSRNFQIKNSNLVNNLAFMEISPAGGTNVGMYGLFIPKGTGFNSTNQTGFDFYNTDYNADGTNYEVFSLAAKGAKMVINSDANGTGTVRPIEIQTDAVTRAIFASTLTTITTGLKLTTLAGNGAGLAAIDNNGNVTWTSSSGGGGGDVYTSTANTFTSSGTLRLPTVSGNSNLSVGSFELQGRGVNESYWFENMYFNGTDYKYRAAGHGSLFYFGNGSFTFYNAPTSTAGATATVVERFQVNTTGDVKIGTASAYLNWGATGGTSGYGFRDNAGTMQYKNSGGSWTSFSAGGSSDWTTSGSDIYRASGVGIGAAPSSGIDLHVNKSTTAAAWVTGGVSNGNYAQILIGEGTPATGGYAAIERFSNATTGLVGELVVSNLNKGITLSTSYSSGYRKDLGINSSGVVRFNDAYSFPTTIGSPGQVLTVPGSGTGLVWSTVSGGGGTDFYTTDGTLTSTRTVSGGSNTLNLGATGSKLSNLTLYVTNKVLVADGAIQYNVYATSDANFSFDGMANFVEMVTSITANRTLTMPSASGQGNGTVVKIILPFSANSFHWNLNAGITDIKTGSTFTQLEWGTTYEFYVTGGLSWLLINKY